MIEAQVAEDLHNVYLSDELGFSFSTVAQRNYITMKVDGPTSGEWRDSLMSAFDEVSSTDQSSQSWYFRDLVRGGTYLAHLYSSTEGRTHVDMILDANHMLS